MKTKFFILFTFLFITTITTFSQSNYYYKDNKKQEINIDRKHINLFVNSNFNKSFLTSLGLTTSIWHENELKPEEQWATLTFNIEPNDNEYLIKTIALLNMPGVTGVAKHFKNENYTSVGTSNLFYVKLRSLTDTITLKQFAIEKKVTIHHQLPYIPEWFALYRNIEALDDVVELSNQFYESQLFENVDPNFIFDFLIPEPEDEPCFFDETYNVASVSDGLFPLQWGMFYGEHPERDINICDAWNISTGVNTKIAIIDSGVQLNHPDLITNIANQSYNALTNTSPSTVYSEHGTFVAGISGAMSNNSEGIAGVAPNSKIVSVSHPLSGIAGNLTAFEQLGTGIWWAAFGPEKADVINNSWGIITTTFSSAVLENHINEATSDGRNGKGCIIVFAAGNEAHQMRYPANNPNLDLLTVGATRPDGLKASFSSHGTTLDIVAPGVCIPSTTINSNTSIGDGTSFAAPHVAGVAALILSVNPCLTRQQVYDIIEQTAQKMSPNIYNYTINSNRPNGSWNNNVGYGLLDAYAAVQMAQNMASSHLDLYIKDNDADLGIEPNTTTTALWNSPSIWVRNNQDGLTTHQAPRYNQDTPNYVYVKVANKSCFATSGKVSVKLYYSRPATVIPETTSAAFRSALMPVRGTEWVYIGAVSIPQLQAGAETTINIPWTLPNPIGWYGCTSTFFNTSLLAKIEASNDPNTVAETSNILTNIRNNNNIAGKNLIVIDVNNLNVNQDDPNQNSILVANPYNETHSFSIEMTKDLLETGKPIYQEAEVSFKMDDALYNAWERGGKTAQNIDNTNFDSKKIVNNNQVIIENISLNANELTTLKLNFNFLTAELTDKSKYIYHIVQRDLATNEIVGAVSFEINKEPRPIFEALADDAEIDKDETITISAEQISEPALYNWYDTEGNLIYQGKDLTIATQVAQKYKLEVIATTDGFKDYTEVEVKLKPSVLTNISPNPATDIATIEYKINEGGSAYLMVLGGYGTNASSNNYILDIDLSEININLSNYSNGFYTLALVVNGIIVDAKTLIKQ